MTNKQYLIEFILRYQHYENGILEKLTEDEVWEIYDRLIDWIEGIRR